VELSASFEGSGSSTTASRSDHNHDDEYYNKAHLNALEIRIAALEGLPPDQGQWRRRLIQRLQPVSLWDGVSLYRDESYSDGVVSGTIEPKRVAVLRGKVMTVMVTPYPESPSEYSITGIWSDLEPSGRNV